MRVRVPDGTKCDDELWQDDSGYTARLHPNTYHKDLPTFLHSLNARRLKAGMTVDILSQHNHAVIDVGVIHEVIPHQQFSGATGQFHEAVFAVRRPSGAIRFFSADRLVPTQLAEALYDPTVPSGYVIEPPPPPVSRGEREVAVPHRPLCDD